MKSVLAVDDGASEREMLATVLRYAGYSVREAATGERALELARAFKPDLIIVDILMPTMDGYELVRELRNDPATAAVPVIFYTATYLIEEVRRLAAACGMSHIIVKSWDPEQIIQVVAEALSSAQDSVMPLPREEFHREHLRLLNAKLLQKVEELRDAVILAGTLQVQSDRGGEIASGLGSAYGARPQDLLSKRELEVLAMIAEGAPNARIAERLSIAQSTVHSHVKRITRKLGVSNRTEAAARYLRR